MIQTLAIDRPNRKMNIGEKLSAQFHFDDLQGQRKFRILTVFTLKLFMEKNYLCQLKALINSFKIYSKHFLENHNVKRYGQKYGF